MLSKSRSPTLVEGSVIWQVTMKIFCKRGACNKPLVEIVGKILCRMVFVSGNDVTACLAPSNAEANRAGRQEAPSTCVFLPQPSPASDYARFVIWVASSHQRVPAELASIITLKLNISRAAALTILLPASIVFWVTALLNHDAHNGPTTRSIYPSTLPLRRRYRR